MKKSIKKIIEWTLNYMDMHSEEACDLIFRTGMAETGYRHLEQIKGPAIGFFQVEPDTMHDIIDNYVNYRPEIKTRLYALGYDDTNSVERTMSNIALQVAFCRLSYRRDKHAIPKDIEGQAAYWKRVYNTELGKGTVEHFLEANNV